MLFSFIIRMLSAVSGVEHKIDKRGKEFMSLRFDPAGQGSGHWIKSVVIYPSNKKGNITLLINHGGTRAATGLKFPMSSVLTLKPVKDDLFLVLNKGKVAGFATQYDINKIAAATPQVITTTRYYEPGDGF